MYPARRAACHHTLPATCSGHSQAWGWSCSQATCKGWLASLLNKREENKQKHTDSSFTVSLNYFWRYHVSSGKYVKGQVVTDVGGPGWWLPHQLFGHVWCWRAENGCFSCAKSADYQPMNRMSDVAKTFLSHFCFLLLVLLLVIPESRMNWGLKKKGEVFWIFNFIKHLYRNWAQW